LTIFEWQSFNFILIIALYFVIVFQAPFTERSLGYFFVHLLIGMAFMILQVWISQVASIKKYLGLSFALIVLSFMIVKMSPNVKLIPYSLLFPIVLFGLPVGKFSFTTIPMFVTESGLRNFAFVWLSCILMLSSIILFVRTQVYLFMFV